MHLYLTPAAIGYLTQCVLALAITGYLVYRLRAAHRGGEDTAHLRLVTGIFAATTMLVLLMFGDAALAPTQRLYPVYLENIAIGVLLSVLLQFAYAFPQRYPQRRWEARLLLALSLAYTLWELGFALYRGRLLMISGQVRYRSPAADYAMAGIFLCIPIAFLRQTITIASEQPTWRALWKPRGRTAQASRTFALIFFIPLVLSLLTIGRATARVHPAVFQSSVSAGILLTQFLFALTYLHALPAMLSFQVRHVSIALVTVLAVFSMIGWAMTPPHAADYCPSLVDHQTLRFTPNAQGGYDVAPVEFYFDSEPGAPLAMEIDTPNGSSPDAQAAVPFTFPFYGQTAETLWVMQSGAVGVGAPLDYPSMEYQYATTPAIFPLSVALDAATGGVFAKDAGEKLTLTWQGLRGWHDPQATYTFQLVLHHDGVFTITTHGLPDVTYEPNTSPFSSLWVMGATPGLRGQEPQQVNFADAPLRSGPQGLLQDHYLGFRQHVHQLLAPLAVLIVISSMGVVLSFPAIFAVSLSRPLNALLDGVRRVKAGDLGTPMQVHYYDEIGFLTEAFNEMQIQLRELITELETRVAARTQDLADANTQLRAEIAEREQAQATVIAQQRTLAAYEEREQLGRDLHDGLGQVLGYINVQTQAVQTLLDNEQIAAARGNLPELIQAVQQAHQEIRKHILGLRRSEPVPQDFFTTIHQYIAQFSQRSKLKLTLSLPEEPPIELFTPAVEEQALHILQEGMSNVRKHADAHHIEVIFRLIGQYVQMAIVDDGCGFEMTDAAGVKKPRSKPSNNGEGHFGLQIMRERAEQAGGTLEIRSLPGKGTRLIATLPRFVVAAQAGVKGEDTTHGLRVLLADDSPLFLDGLRNLLTARGVTIVGTARNGREALEKARALRPNVAVLDLNMPGYDGLQATRAIKAELPEMKVLILTVSEDEQNLFEAIRNGASGYLLKNLEANDLCARLDGLMHGEAALAPGMAEKLLAEFTRPTSPPEDPLTPRQWDVLRLVAEGLIYKEVAARLHLSEKTIKYHMGQILEKLHLQNRAEAIAYLKAHEDDL